MPPARPSRKQARRDALFVLYQREVTGEPIDVLLRKLGEREKYAPDPFTEEAAAGVSAAVAALDETLQKYSRDWSLARMAPIERSALRLGLFELQQGATPAEVVATEPILLEAIGATTAGRTGQHTGRSAGDKFVVKDALSTDKIWWDNNKALTPELQQQLEDVQKSTRQQSPEDARQSMEQLAKAQQALKQQLEQGNKERT